MYARFGHGAVRAARRRSLRSANPAAPEGQRHGRRRIAWRRARVRSRYRGFPARGPQTRLTAPEGAREVLRYARTSDDLHPCLHAFRLMAEHVAMEHPGSGIVENAKDVPALARIHERRIAQRPEAAPRANLVEMMPVQVNAMGEGGVVDERDPRGLAPRKTGERRVGHSRSSVERPKTVPTMAPPHGTALHREGQALMRRRRCHRRPRGRQGADWLGYRCGVLSRHRDPPDLVRALLRWQGKRDVAGDIRDDIDPLRRRDHEGRNRLRLRQSATIERDDETFRAGQLQREDPRRRGIDQPQPHTVALP
mmetsp:Transcript_1306/g.2602  ORF Transcript_1306/g.2602 Transcript_1306/m.2602 type:complete len:309 (-) Transcript_1306:609-1535(-)